MSESNQTISLESYAKKVKEGEAFIEEIDGERVEFRVRPPKQGIAFEIQKVLQGIVSANPALMEAQAQGGNLRLSDPGALMRFQELDGRCLVACVDGITPDNVMHFTAGLPPDCDLLKRVKTLCGVEIYDLQEDAEGN